MDKPPYFNPEGQAAFKAMPVDDTDVILCSYAKCGTSWMNQIILFLVRSNEHGSLSKAIKEYIGGSMQVYPDGVPHSTPGKFFGGATFDDLLAQPSPRLFTTHAKAADLPVLKRGGRLVLIARNPKDALISQFFFFKKMAGGTRLHPDGNPVMKKAVAGGLEAAYDAYLEPIHSADSTYGSFWEYYRDMAKLSEQLGPSRAFVTFYERLHEDFDGEVRRLAAFLELPLSETKLDALKAHVSFKAMATRAVPTMRKGVVGDFHSHLTPTHWSKVERCFEDTLGSVKALAPLRKWMAVPPPTGSKSRL